MRIGDCSHTLQPSRDPLLEDLWEPFQPAERRTKAERQDRAEREAHSEGMQPVSPHCSGLRPWKDWHHAWRGSFCSAFQSTRGCVVGGLKASVALGFSASGITLCGYDQRYASGWGCGSTCGQPFHSKPWPLLYHCILLATGLGLGCLYRIFCAFTLGARARGNWRTHSHFCAAAEKL